jgi:hypothetical protein
LRFGATPGINDLLIMAMKKYIQGFLVFVLMGLQLALAQHATVHFVEDEPLMISGGQHQPPADPDKHDRDKICQICLFEKNYSFVLVSPSAVISLAVSGMAYAVLPLPVLHTQEAASAYYSRGPPVSLS